MPSGLRQASAKRAVQWSGGKLKCDTIPMTAVARARATGIGLAEAFSPNADLLLIIPTAKARSQKWPMPGPTKPLTLEVLTCLRYNVGQALTGTANPGTASACPG